ncbi:MAG TPA: NAD(P)/FAD-dependent oxidoreductase [Candidatus Paceibacterota bacterium]|nr:NAD(P)/FAD-dependent oxidoreductase [Verrucomicrobiota bacterium]HRY46513.1 NAD(P)/FAD-dependent oxidoreductase [Candidatus Paceibacterota bacterium]HRZ99864.1 NAD(P)/FAD-dependent oxidoreductase [Candidatus Paceibacterota bacterium]
MGAQSTVFPDHPESSAADVIIVGGGPVGLLLANLLGSAHVRTWVFEKRETPLESSMAIGVTPPSLEILKQLGLDQAFSSAGVPVRYAEVHESGTRLGRLAFDHLPSDYPFFLSIPQARTVEILRESLRRFSSVRIRDGTEFMGLTQEQGGVKVVLRDARTRVTFETQAPFVVGCDGHRSAVREIAELRVRERTYRQRFVMADFLDESGLGIEARLFFTPEASVESFPLPGGWRRWIVLGDEWSNDMSLQYLTRTVQRLTGFNLSRHSARFVSKFGARRMLVNRYYAGRVLLAGDAAHVMSSIGGQGMNTGFADAELAAALLPGLLKNPIRIPEAFATYDRIRRRACNVAANRAERGMWLGTLRGHFASAFRKHLIRDVLFSPLLRSRLAPHFAMLTIPFRNLNQVPPELLISHEFNHAFYPEHPRCHSNSRSQAGL